MLAQTPPMGWNSWNTFGSNINEQLIFEIADAMVDKGYRDAGYEYLVIDDCWSCRERDRSGKLVADPEKFPHGMKYVADYVHSKGLKFGMYSAAGIMTCAGYPGSYGHEFVDAKTFAEWGIDYLKYDFCHFPDGGNCKMAYLTMSNALRTCGRDILFSACNWGVDEPGTWMKQIGAHMYRSDVDILNHYPSIKEIGMRQFDKFYLSGQGCFNDIDMLICGVTKDGRCAINIDKIPTNKEFETHFGLWCMLGTPLIMGADLKNCDDFNKSLMQNKELIKINQDPDCRPCLRIHSNLCDPNMLVLAKLLCDGDYALGFFNFTENEKSGWFYPDALGFPAHSGAEFNLTNLYTGESTVGIRDYFSCRLAPHQSAVFRVKVTTDYGIR